MVAYNKNRVTYNKNTPHPNNSHITNVRAYISHSSLTTYISPISHQPTDLANLPSINVDKILLPLQVLIHFFLNISLIQHLPIYVNLLGLRSMYFVYYYQYFFSLLVKLKSMNYYHGHLNLLL